MINKKKKKRTAPTRNVDPFGKHDTRNNVEKMSCDILSLDGLLLLAETEMEIEKNN